MAPKLTFFHIGHLFNNALRECGRILHEKNLPIDMDQVQVLLYIHYSASGSQQEIGRGVQRDKASVNRTIALLSRKGIVSIEPDKQDKRRTLIELTPLGKELAKQVEEILTEFDSTLTAPFTADERKQFSLLIDKLMPW